MNVPDLLHPQYPLRSTSYCMHATAQISLELTKNSYEKPASDPIDRT